MKTKYIKIISVVSVVVFIVVFGCINVYAIPAEGAGDGFDSVSPLYSLNDGFVYERGYYSLADSETGPIRIGNSIITPTKESTNNPLFSMSSPFYLTQYQVAGIWDEFETNTYFGFGYSHIDITGENTFWGDAGFYQRVTLPWASPFSFSKGRGAITPEMTVQVRTVSGKYHTFTFGFVKYDITGIEAKNEGYFAGSILLLEDFYINYISVSFSFDMSENQGTVTSGYWFAGYYLGNIIMENVSSSVATAPNYAPPNTDDLDQVVQDEIDGDAVLEDTVNDIDDLYGGFGNIVVSTDLYAEFQLVKDFLSDLLAINIVYRLIMVSIALGVMVFLINLGGTISRHFKGRGD